jgi:hypothetical protein
MLPWLLIVNLRVEKIEKKCDFYNNSEFIYIFYIYIHINCVSLISKKRSGKIVNNECATDVWRTKINDK